MHKFRKCVQRYNGNHKVKSFSYFEQFLCMAFAQLTYRESLLDIEACLRSLKIPIYGEPAQVRLCCAMALAYYTLSGGVIIPVMADAAATAGLQR